MQTNPLSLWFNRRLQATVHYGVASKMSIWPERDKAIGDRPRQYEKRARDFWFGPTAPFFISAGETIRRIQADFFSELQDRQIPDEAVYFLKSLESEVLKLLRRYQEYEKEIVRRFGYIVPETGTTVTPELKERIDRIFDYDREWKQTFHCVTWGGRHVFAHEGDAFRADWSVPFLAGAIYCDFAPLGISLLTTQPLASIFPADRLENTLANIRILQALDKFKTLPLAICKQAENHVRDFFHSLGANYIFHEGEFYTGELLMFVDHVPVRESVIPPEARSVIIEYSPRLWNASLVGRTYWRDNPRNFSGTPDRVYVEAMRYIGLVSGKRFYDEWEGTMVDFGCGVAEFLALLEFSKNKETREKQRCFGIDASPEMVAVAKPRGFNINQFDIGDSQALDRWKIKEGIEHIDFAVCLDVLQDLSSEGRKNFFDWIITNSSGKRMRFFGSLIFEGEIITRTQVEDEITAILKAHQSAGKKIDFGMNRPGNRLLIGFYLDP